MEEARAILGSEFHCEFTEGHRYLGGFLGTQPTFDEWLAPKIQEWVAGIEKLARIATRYPQSAYAALTKSLQMQWQHTQRVNPSCSAKLAPLEHALHKTFLPALLQEDSISNDFRQQLALPVKQGGIGIPNPVTTANGRYSDSVTCTRKLTQSLLETTPEPFDVRDYKSDCSSKRHAASKSREKANESTITTLANKLQLPERRRFLRSVDKAKQTGNWLTVTPDFQNGTDLTANEFRDSLRMRYNLIPHHLPHKCDGCKETFTVQHDMTCHKGGFISIRHNELADEWSDLCSKAFKSHNVRDEPLIHSGRGPVMTQTASGTTEAPPETRGHVAVPGVFERSVTKILDISDIDCPTYRGQDPAKVLAGWGKAKKSKHLQASWLNAAPSPLLPFPLMAYGVLKPTPPVSS